MQVSMGVIPKIEGEAAERFLNDIKKKENIMRREPKIELISCESGEWQVLKLDGEMFAEGHSIRNEDWITLFSELFGVDIIEKEISDLDMEEGNY
jgi:hypothetical protein